MDLSSSLRVEGHEYTSSQQSPTSKAAIISFLKLVVFDTSLVTKFVSEFSQAWKVHDFLLGDSLSNYSSDSKSKKGGYLYLVCPGKAQLLGFDTTLGREVSTQLLLQQEAFGVDNSFCNQTLSYRAIAASADAIVFPHPAF